MKRYYGRNQDPPMPEHRMLMRESTVSPLTVDLRASCGPMKNQQNMGSCTGHAFSSAIEWIWRKYFGKSPILSPLYLYALELIANGNFPDDDGSNGTTGSEVSIVNGCCENSMYPDASLRLLTPTPAMNANAAQYKMGAYHGLRGSSTAISVLGDPVPWPIEIGFSCYASIESEEVANSGIYNPGGSGDEPLNEGHEVLLVGYDIAPNPVLRPIGCPPAMLAQNSWGKGWGWQGSGFFWVALSVLNHPSTDLKIVHSGAPWK